jgi:hypothetical protein
MMGTLADVDEFGDDGVPGDWIPELKYERSLM